MNFRMCKGQKKDRLCYHLSSILSFFAGIDLMNYFGKNTPRHIFEKVLICIERGMYSVHFKEMNLF